MGTRKRKGAPVPARHDRAKRAPTVSRREEATVSQHDITQVFRTLGLQDEQSRRRYLEWSEEGKRAPKPGFDVIERGDTRSFE